MGSLGGEGLAQGQVGKVRLVAVDALFGALRPGEDGAAVPAILRLDAGIRQGEGRIGAVPIHKVQRPYAVLLEHPECPVVGEGHVAALLALVLPPLQGGPQGAGILPRQRQGPGRGLRQGLAQALDLAGTLRAEVILQGLAEGGGVTLRDDARDVGIPQADPVEVLLHLKEDVGSVGRRDDPSPLDHSAEILRKILRILAAVVIVHPVDLQMEAVEVRIVRRTGGGIALPARERNDRVVVQTGAERVIALPDGGFAHELHADGDPALVAVLQVEEAAVALGGVLREAAGAVEKVIHGVLEVGAVRIVPKAVQESVPLRLRQLGDPVQAVVVAEVEVAHQGLLVQVRDLRVALFQQELHHSGVEGQGVGTAVIWEVTLHQGPLSAVHHEGQIGGAITVATEPAILIDPCAASPEELPGIRGVEAASDTIELHASAILQGDSLYQGHTIHPPVVRLGLGGQLLHLLKDIQRQSIGGGDHIAGDIYGAGQVVSIADVLQLPVDLKAFAVKVEVAAEVRLPLLALVLTPLRHPDKAGDLDVAVVPVEIGPVPIAEVRPGGLEGGLHVRLIDLAVPEEVEEAIAVVKLVHPVAVQVDLIQPSAVDAQQEIRHAALCQVVIVPDLVPVLIIVIIVLDREAAVAEEIPEGIQLHAVRGLGYDLRLRDGEEAVSLPGRKLPPVRTAGHPLVPDHRHIELAVRGAVGADAIVLPILAGDGVAAAPLLTVIAAAGKGHLPGLHHPGIRQGELQNRLRLRQTGGDGGLAAGEVGTELEAAVPLLLEGHAVPEAAGGSGGIVEGHGVSLPFPGQHLNI